MRVDEGVISSYPMKGTIDASVPDAGRVILEDYKERSEHNTIVDLIRNDLNRVAERVDVRRFRYIDRLRVSRGEILQVSSEVTGRLTGDYYSRLGEVVFGMLPAGSISGAPKPSTLRIIARKARCLPCTVFQCGKQRAFAFYFWFGSNCCHRASNSSSTRAICPVR